MADLSAIIKQLSQQMKIAADKLEASSGSSTGASPDSSSPDQLSKIQQKIELQDKLGASQKELNDLRVEQMRIEAELAKQAVIADENDKEALKTFEEKKKAYESVVRDINRAQDAKENLSAAGRELSGVFGSLKQTILGASPAITKMTKNLSTAATKGAMVATKSFVSLGKNLMNSAGRAKVMSGILPALAAGFKMLGSAVKGAMTFGFSILFDVLSGIASIMIETITSVDNAGVAFARATGSADRWNQSLGRVMDTTYALGIPSEQVAQDFARLTQEFSAFGQISTDMEVQLAKQVSLMNELGVASGTQIKVMDSLNRVMGLSAPQAAEFSKDLFDMASAARMAPEEMFASFQAALPQLSVYGNKMKGEFMNLSAQAKATGMSVQELLSVVGKFDTFEGAANAAQGLNAFLGGPYLNTVELLTATESERVDLLRDSFDRSGKSFNKMDRFMQKGIAQQLGMSVDQARRQFSMSREEVEKYNARLKEAEEFNTALEERVKGTMPLMETLKVAFKEIALGLIQSFIPAVGDSASGMNGMQDIMKAIHGFIPKLIRGIGVFVGHMLDFASKMSEALDWVPGVDTSRLTRSLKAAARKSKKTLGKVADSYERSQAEAETARLKSTTKKDDFIVSKGQIHPFDSRDQFMAAKPNGFFDQTNKRLAHQLEKLTRAIEGLKGSQNISVEMDGREVARLVNNRIQKSHSTNLPSSGRIR